MARVVHLVPVEAEIGKVVLETWASKYCSVALGMCFHTCSTIANMTCYASRKSGTIYPERNHGLAKEHDGCAGQVAEVNMGGIAGYGPFV